MNKLRFVSVILLAVIMAVPQAPLRVQAAEQAVTTTFVPVGGLWTGKTKLGYPVSFTVNAMGTSWSGLYIQTRVNFSSTCSAVVTGNASGPGAITSSKFSWSTPTFKIAGTFTSATAASGTYTFTNYKVSTPCGLKTFSQGPTTWTARAPFSKLVPVNGATNRPVSPTLSWSASTGAAGYKYCVDTASHADGDTTCPSGWLSSGTARSVTLSTALLEDTTYYWQVQTTNTLVEANGGVWWSFTTGTLPTGFGKTSPSDTASSQALNTTLNWGTSTGAASYQYCYDTTNDGICGGTWTSTGTATTATPGFVPGNTYYWQVRAVNSVGYAYADTGTWWSFATIPPSVLTLKSVAIQDGWILESSENSSIGGKAGAAGGAFYLGDDKLNRQYRAILSFPTGTLPAGAKILGVTLRILKTPSGSTPVSPFATLGNIMVDINKGTFGLSSLQATDFQATASKTGMMAISNAPMGGWYSKAIASANFTYINRSGPTQFRLRFAKDDNHNFAANYLSFYTGNAILANRPQLVIQYYIP